MEEFFQYVAPDEGAWPSKWFVYGLPRESVIDRCVHFYLSVHLLSWKIRP